LDRRRRLDRRHVRRAQHHPARPRGSGAHRRCRADRDRAPPEAAAHPQVDRLHGDPLVRHRYAALRRAADCADGELRPRPRHVVREPARLPDGLPVRGLQRRGGDRGRPAPDRPRRGGAHRHAQRALQDGRLMQIRMVGLGVRVAILVTFAVFFIGPVVWLILAPTKSDRALIENSPFSFGDFHHISLAWKHLDAFSSHIFRRWIGNTLFYAFSATGITLVAGVPAGYGLAIGNFPGRKVVLSLTLVV